MCVFTIANQSESKEKKTATNRKQLKLHSLKWRHCLNEFIHWITWIANRTILVRVENGIRRIRIFRSKVYYIVFSLSLPLFCLDYFELITPISIEYIVLQWIGYYTGLHWNCPALIEIWTICLVQIQTILVLKLEI